MINRTKEPLTLTYQNRNGGQIEIVDESTPDEGLDDLAPGMFE